MTYWFISKIQKTGTIFVILMLRVIAIDQAEGDKTLNLNIGFDLTRGNNGAPVLRIRNFEEFPEFGTENLKESKRKRALRAESASESEEKGGDKTVTDAKESKGSDDGSEDDADTSGSDDDRRVSTRGISPDEFVPKRIPIIHGRKGSDFE